MYNDREKNRKATLIIDMKGNQTEITDPENKGAGPRQFSFDFSYWSHDEFNERADGYLEPKGTRYADQVNVYVSCNMICTFIFSHVWWFSESRIIGLGKKPSL